MPVRLRLATNAGHSEGSFGSGVRGAAFAAGALGGAAVATVAGRTYELDPEGRWELGSVREGLAAPTYVG